MQASTQRGPLANLVGISSALAIVAAAAWFVMGWTGEKTWPILLLVCGAGGLLWAYRRWTLPHTSN